MFASLLAVSYAGYNQAAMLDCDNVFCQIPRMCLSSFGRLHVTKV